MDFDEFVQSELQGDVASAKKAGKRKLDKGSTQKKTKATQGEAEVDAESRHARQLSRLATTDPDFFAFLQETDKSLLTFGNEDGKKVKSKKLKNGHQKEAVNGKGNVSINKEVSKKPRKLAEQSADAEEMDDDNSAMSVDGEEDDEDSQFEMESDAEEEMETGFDEMSSEEEDIDEETSFDEESADVVDRRRSAEIVKVTSSLIESWCATLRNSQEDKNARTEALRNLLSTFIAAVSNATRSEEVVAHDDSDDDGTKKAKKRSKKHEADEKTGRKSTREQDSLRKRDAIAKRYRVVGNQLFNQTVSTCLSELPAAFASLFDLDIMAKKAVTTGKEKGKQAKAAPAPKPASKFHGVGALAELYCASVTDLLSYLADTQTQCAVMRHALRIVPLFAAFPRRLRVLARCAAQVWSTDDEPCRVLAFLIIHRAVKLGSNDFTEFCFKRMYLAFVRNCKFTTVASLGCIRFMQRCVIELFTCNWSLAFRYAFIYTRQLAVFLRNAICQNDQRSASHQKPSNAKARNKKRQQQRASENEKTKSIGGAMRKCASWQFVHSVTLWARLVVAAHQRGATGSNGQFELLVYPLVELANGLIKLCDAPAYYPLRIHLVRVLTTLSSGTGRYVPALAPLLSVFSAVDLNKRCLANSNASKKPLNFACTLRLSTAALRDRRSFLDGLIDELNDAMLENLSAHSHRMDFPEYATPFVVEMRALLKRIRVAAYDRTLRQTFDKVKQTCLLIRDRRAATDEHTASLDLTDQASIDRWNTHSKSVGTPLHTYFLQHRKTRDVQIRLMLANAADKDRGADDEEPIERVLAQPRAKHAATDDDRNEFSALFDRFYFDELDRPVEEQANAQEAKSQTTSEQGPVKKSKSKNKKRRKAEKNQQKVTKSNGNSSATTFSLEDLPNLPDTVD